MSTIIIKNGTLVDYRTECRADLVISGGKICKIAPSVDVEEEKRRATSGGVKVIDAAGCLVLPGLIDAHTHYHLVSRGTVTADSFREGSRTASFGGVTTVIDFADHNKGMNLEESAKFRLDEMARGGMAVDYTLHQGVYGHGYDASIPENLERLKELGIRTLKIFTTYRNTGYLLDDPASLRDLFRNAKRLGMLVTVHCEYNPFIEKINDNWKGTYLPKDHPDMRPAEAEAEAIRTYGEIAFEEDCPLYIVHCSSEAGLDEIRRLRGMGAEIYAETTPTYLFLERSRLEGNDGALFVMTPPLRTERDNKILRDALSRGEFNVVATDHCSFTREQKLSSCDVRTIYPGVPGTEEMFPLLYTAFKDRMPLSNLVSLVTNEPAKLFGISGRKGSLSVGMDGDVCIYDPRGERILDDSIVHTAAKYTAFRGLKIEGKVSCTISRGRVVMERGEYFGEPGEGRFIEQSSTLEGGVAVWPPARGFFIPKDAIRKVCND